MPTSKDHELRNVTGTCCDEIKAGRIEGYSRPNLKSTSGGRTMLGKAEHSFQCKKVQRKSKIWHVWATTQQIHFPRKRQSMEIAIFK